MRKIRILGAAFFAVLALSAVSTSIASAKHDWWVNGALLPVGVAEKILAETKTGTEWLLTATVFNVKLDVLCKKITLTGTIFNVEEPTGSGQVTGRDKGVVLFSECKVDEPSGCVVEEPIRVPNQAGTEGLTYLVEYTKEAKTFIGDAFLPNAGSDIFAVLKISGAFCAAAGTYNVEAMLGGKKEAEGGVVAEISNALVSEADHDFIFPCPPIKEATNWKGEKILTGNLLVHVLTEEKSAEFCGTALADLESKLPFDVK